MKLSLLLLFLASTFFSFAQPYIDWTNHLKDSTYYIATTDILLVDSFTYVAGSLNNGNTNYFILSKINNHGDTIWTSTLPNYEAPQSIGGIGGGTQIIANDISGNIYTVGSFTDSTYNFLLVKYNPLGDTIWTRRLIKDFGYAIAIDKTGNTIITGGEDSIGLVGDCVTFKYDSNGNLQWRRNFTIANASYNVEGNKIAIDENNNVFIAGDFGLLKYDSMGSLIWSNIDASFVGTGGEGVNVKIDKSQNIIYSTRNLNNEILKYNQQGSLLDSTNYAPPGYSAGNYRLYFLTIDSSNNIIATGGCSNGNWNVVTIKYDTALNQIWQKTHVNNSPTYIVSDTADNIYIVCSDSLDELLKYNSAGILLWDATYSTAPSSAAKIVLDDANNIYITGQDSGKGSLTLKYSQCGTSPNISSQPTNQIQCVNDSAVFTLSTLGNGITYQWQYSANGITFTNCTSPTYYSGDSTNTLTVRNLSNFNNYYYRCSVTSHVVCNTISDTVLLTVNPIVYKNQNKIICPGGNIQVGTHIHTLPGTYHDTLTSSLGCDSIVVTNLSFYPGGAPVITVLDSSCNGTPATLLATCFGDTAVSFLWSNGATNSIITTSQPGYDSVRVTTTQGCLTPYSQAFPFPAIPNCGGLLLLQSDSIINFDTLQVNVYVENADSLFSISAYLHFDSSLLQLVWDTVGNFYGPSPNNLVYQTPGSGLIDFEIASAISHVGVSGNGLLYTFKFKLLTLPNSIASNAPFTAYTLLTLSNPSVLDALGNQRDVSMPKPDTALIGIEVWPGDLNNDHVVNVLDILPIGYFYLFTGPARDLYCSPNCNQWSGQPAQIWGSNISAHNSSAYETFADANGDGVINLGDAADIQFNLGSIHALKPKSNGPTNARSVYPPLTAYSATTQIDSTQLPYTLNVSVNLGSPAMPVDYVLGIAFDLLFDADCVDTNSLTTNSVTYSNLFGTYQTDYIRVADFTQKAEGKISFGITRFGVPPINGNGDSILNVSFKLINGCNGGYFHIIPNILGCDSADGGPILLSNVGDSIRVIATGPSAINNVEITSRIKIFPNPANDLLTIYSPNNISSVITLYDVNGQIILTQNFIGVMQNIDISPLASGVYIINVRNSSETITQKIIKE